MSDTTRTLSYTLERRSTDKNGRCYHHPFIIEPRTDFLDLITLVQDADWKKDVRVSAKGEEMKIRVNWSKDNVQKGAQMVIPLDCVERVARNMLLLLCELSYNHQRPELKKIEEIRLQKEKEHLAHLKKTLSITIKPYTKYFVGTKEKPGGMNIIDTGMQEGEIIFIVVYLRSTGQIVYFKKINIFLLQEQFEDTGYEERESVR